LNKSWGASILALAYIKKTNQYFDVGQPQVINDSLVESATKNVITAKYQTI
jgi:hypothetical protein